jgi:5,10-methylenetetrahydromethanopterin reductase
MLGQIGVMLHTGDMPMEEIVRYAQEAEALGYEGFWVTEESGKEAFSVLSFVAQGTQRIHLGTSIVNFYSRTPTLLAMGASTLYRATNGRFVHFGLGTGGIGFTERGHGLKIERPLTRAKETVEIVRGLLTQERFSYEGKWFHVQKFRLREGPLDARMPIYLAALGPQMTGLAARVADGFIANCLTEETYEMYAAILREKAAAAGRDPREVRIFTLAMMAGESDEAVEAMRRGVAFYLASPHYYPVAEVSGYGSQAKQIQQVWGARDFAAASRLVSDAMVEKFAIMGSPETRRKKLHWMMSHGVYPILYPIFRPQHTVEDHFDVIRLGARYLSAE